MYQNGKTALDYVSEEIDQSIRDLDGAAAAGFPGCPPEGKNFHLAIGRAMRAQLMWQGVQVEHAIEADKEHKRRSVDKSPAPEIEAETRFGKFHASGTGAMKPIIWIFAIVVLGVVIIRMNSEIGDVGRQLKTVTQELQKK